MKKFFFKTSGETPAKKNSRINTRSGRSFPSKRFSQWHAGALAELVRQKQIAGICEPLSGAFKITLLLIHGDKRRRDADNATASIFDTLQDAGILADDNTEILKQIFIYNAYKKNEPAAYIVLEELKAGEDLTNLINAINDYLE